MPNGLNEDLEHIARQERELALPHWTRRLLWTWVCDSDVAQERGLAVVVDVRRFGQPLFYAAMEGTTPDNPESVRRKSNVVARFHRSSYAVGIREKMKGVALAESQGLAMPTTPPMAGHFL